MTNIKSAALPEPNWALRLGASSLPSVSFPGTSVPGTGPCAFDVHALPRVRGKVAVVVAPPQQDAVATLFGQTNVNNYMTGASAVGEGASGPPPHREPV